MTQPVYRVDGKEISAALVEAFGSKPTLLERVKENTAEVDLHYFANLTDWLVMLLLVGIRHAMPASTSEEAAEVARFVASRIYQPGQKHIWQISGNWIDRRSLDQAIRRVMGEFQRTAQSAEKGK